MRTTQLKAALESLDATTFIIAGFTLRTTRTKTDSTKLTSLTQVTSPCGTEKDHLHRGEKGIADRIFIYNSNCNQ